jgi:anti-anti-sigma factor
MAHPEAAPGLTEPDRSRYVARRRRVSVLQGERALSDTEGRQQKEPPRVDVELRPACAPAFGGIVRLHGEHDMSTSDDVLGAIAPIEGDVLIDLSDCAFLDSTVIRVVLASFDARARQGCRLELVVPAANTTMTRTVEISGIRELLTVHESAEIA